MMLTYDDGFDAGYASCRQSLDLAMAAIRRVHEVAFYARDCGEMFFHDAIMSALAGPSK